LHRQGRNNIITALCIDIYDKTNTNV
jgi:hypothetical protein